MNVNFIKCSSLTINNVPRVPGQLIFVTDTLEQYMDLEDNRICITDRIYFDNINNIQTLIEKKIYINTKTSTMYICLEGKLVQVEQDTPYTRVFKNNEDGTRELLSEKIVAIDTEISKKLNWSSTVSSIYGVDENKNQIMIPQATYLKVLDYETDKQATQTELTSITTTLSGVGTNLTNLTSEVEDIENNKLPGIDSSITQINAKDIAQDESLSLINTAINNINATNLSQDSKISGLETGVGTINTNIENITSKVNTLETTTIPGINTTLEGLQTSVQDNTTNITAMNSNITTLLPHLENTENPHNVTKAQIGLENVDNTSDLEKPVSTAVQATLDTKQNALDESLNTTNKTIVGAINELLELIQGLQNI